MVFAGDGSGGGGSHPAGASGAVSLGFHVVRGRWFMVFACFLIMAAAGATYIFSIYSKDLKASLGYDQQTLNTISFFKDLGGNVGVLSGLIMEVTPPWVVLLIGAGMNLFGYLMIYLSITGAVRRPAVWQMCLYICVGANSQTFANTGALVTCVKNFPRSRGVVLGILKGFVGLSGAIITQLYLAVYGDDSKSLVLLIAWLPAAISVISINTIRMMPVVSDANELKVFYRFLYISLALAVYLMIVIVVEKRVTFSRPEYGVSAAVVILILFLPLAVVVHQEIFTSRSHPLEPAPVELRMPSLPTTITVENNAGNSPPPPSSCLRNMFSPPERGEDYTILQALVSVDMLILFFSTICGVGGTLTAIDNMGQIGESLGYPQRSVSTFVSLISIWNYAGRVTAGFLSETLLTKYRFPRPLMLTGVLLLSCVAHLLIAFGVPGSLYIASVLIGFCFGAQWPLLFAVISEIFGLKYYSTLYNFGGVASPIGSYIFNVRVAGHLYDREASKQNNRRPSTGGRDKTCMGVRCFKMSFIIIAGATVVGALVSLVLVLRTRRFYKGDIYAKFRQPAEAENGTSAASAGDDDGEKIEIVNGSSTTQIENVDNTRVNHQ